MNVEPVSDPKLGIYLYKNVLKKEFNLIERLETLISNNENHQFYKWSEALVGYSESIKDYRDCVDFKVREMDALASRGDHRDLRDIFDVVKTNLYQCLNDYESRYNLRMEYMEAINFVKYGVGQHFQVHADHGFSYTCTVSRVMYLNDDYEGGELWFPNLDITIKPEYGDIILFPSTYIYSHSSLPVKSGVKYAAVTMFDYNDKNHRDHTP
jgi:hypothetical protein